jgi:23S rRNA (cytosine1962-C5)-methyltransferase
MHAPPLRLKKGQERRLLAGHCWIFSNEVDIASTPLKGFEAGEPVEVIAYSGRPLGFGYVNPRSLICARLVSHDLRHPLTPALWVQRIRTALTLRDRLYRTPFYRLIFGESDGLPGLIVDRYGELLAVQITTAGMERASADILTALEQVVRPKTLVLRNDTAVRDLEGLVQGTETILGEPPGDLELVEHGARFLVSPLTGQKTGWFFDQSENRARLPRFGTPRRVLDVCSYVGAWGLQAALNGAQMVICVDSSSSALERVGENAKHNGVLDRVSGLQGDAFEALRGLREQQERFDLVLLDPPAFIKRRKDAKEGMRAYQRLNRLGLDLLEPGGMLVTSSCSFHMGHDAFLRTVQQAARRAGLSLQLLEAGGQGPDHPIHPAIPETGYLKTFFLRALPSF